MFTPVYTHCWLKPNFTRALHWSDMETKPIATEPMVAPPEEKMQEDLPPETTEETVPITDIKVEVIEEDEVVEEEAEPAEPEEVEEEEEEILDEEEEEEILDFISESDLTDGDICDDDNPYDCGDSPYSIMSKTSQGVTGKVFHDCVHGSMWMHPLCVALVDTPEFQRLRNIKQLGLAYLVYPGAAHNRFEHSLGVCYLASRMVESLERNCAKNGRKLVTAEEALCVQVAGLCHDLGHGPFSHTWEVFLKESGIPWKHEKMSLAIFDTLADRLREEFEKYKLFEPEKKFIKELMKGEPLVAGEPLSRGAEKYFLYEIVANKTNDIDVDKWEYLARDAAQLGVPVAFDSRRLFEFCRVGIDKDAGDPRMHITYRDKEAISVFAMFQARSELHYFAYQHRVVKSLEAMLVDAFKRADNAGYKINGHKLSEVHKDIKTFCTLTDNIFYNLLYSAEESLKQTRDLLIEMCERKIYQFVGLMRINEEEINIGETKICPETYYIDLVRDKITQSGILSSKQLDNLVYRKIEMKVRRAPKRDALDTVYVYEKKSPDRALTLKCWKNVPVFSIDVEKLCHIDILVLSRSKLHSEIQEKIQSSLQGCPEKLKSHI